jgi:hypothetical protein
MIQTNADYATIGGGGNNTIRPNTQFGTIGGGIHNTIQAHGNYATIPGGMYNSATNHAFAAGHNAKANHTGSFVWGDSFAVDVASSADNEFTVRASGGVRFFSNSSMDAGVSLAAGGGSWTSISDRNAKENYQEVDSIEVLAKVAALPLKTWNYKSQDTTIRHMGPVAQDFKAAFGLGESDTGITSVDADGVALAAIQGLNQKLEAEVDQKTSEIAELKQAVARLTKLVGQLSQGLHTGGQ